MCTSIKRRSPRKFDRSVLTKLDSKVREKMYGLLWQLRKMALKLVNYDL